MDFRSITRKKKTSKDEISISRVNTKGKKEKKRKEKALSADFYRYKVLLNITLAYFILLHFI